MKDAWISINNPTSPAITLRTCQPLTLARGDVCWLAAGATTGGPLPGDLVTVEPVKSLGWYVSEKLFPFAMEFGFCHGGTKTAPSRMRTMAANHLSLLPLTHRV